MTYLLQSVPFHTTGLQLMQLKFNDLFSGKYRAIGTRSPPGKERTTVPWCTSRSLCCVICINFDVDWHNHRQHWATNHNWHEPTHSPPTSNRHKRVDASNWQNRQSALVSTDAVSTDICRHHTFDTWTDTIAVDFNVIRQRNLSPTIF